MPKPNTWIAKQYTEIFNYLNYHWEFACRDNGVLYFRKHPYCVFNVAFILAFEKFHLIHTSYMSITELRQNTHYFPLHAAVVEVVFFNDLLLVQKIAAAQSYCSYNKLYTSEALKPIPEWSKLKKMCCLEYLFQVVVSQGMLEHREIFSSLLHSIIWKGFRVENSWTEKWMLSNYVTYDVIEPCSPIM